MTIVVANELSKRLFIWGVLAIVVLPRHHIDRIPCSIGGQYSHSFRKLLAASVVLNLVRLAAKLQGNVRWFADTMGVIQVVSLSFLCFLTPYVLQTWMVQRINIPGGKPGSNLIGPLYGSGLLSIIGVILCRTVHPNLWCIKRLGNIVGTPSILQTMKMYNSLTSVGGLHHHGRGTITGQTMVIVEYWHLITQLLCVIGFALDRRHTNDADYSQWDNCLKAFRDIAFVSDWTRVCVHGMFINLLDEMYLTSSSSSGSTSCGTSSGASSTHSTPRQPRNYDEEEIVDWVESPHQITTYSPKTDQNSSQMVSLLSRSRTPDSSADGSRGRILGHTHGVD